MSRVAGRAFQGDARVGLWLAGLGGWGWMPTLELLGHGDLHLGFLWVGPSTRTLAMRPGADQMTFSAQANWPGWDSLCSG